jgi:hypothetical protein
MKAVATCDICTCTTTRSRGCVSWLLLLLLLLLVMVKVASKAPTRAPYTDVQARLLLLLLG